MNIVDFLAAAEELFFMASAIVVGVSIANFVTRRLQRMPCDRRRRYAVYCGRQEGFAGGDGFTLWTLTDHRLGFKGSTVDEHWLDDAIEAHEQKRVAPKPLRLHGAWFEGMRVMRKSFETLSVDTLAGERWIEGRLCQIHVTVTADRSCFICPVKAGPDAP